MPGFLRTADRYHLVCAAATHPVRRDPWDWRRQMTACTARCPTAAPPT